MIGGLSGSNNNLAVKKEKVMKVLEQPWAKCDLVAAAALRIKFCGLFVAF